MGMGVVNLAKQELLLPFKPQREHTHLVLLKEDSL